MTRLDDDGPSPNFESGDYITRRLVRAWQLKAPSTYLAPGASEFELMPEGTWVLEDVGRRTSVSEGADRRWAVQAHLFPRKYRRLKKGRYPNKDLYLNLESIKLESVQSHKSSNENESSLWEQDNQLRTAEGPQQINDQEDLIATGKSGDCWPIKRARVDSGEYRRLCLLNRILLALAPARLGYLTSRFLGMALVVAATIGSAVGVYTILSIETDAMDLSDATLRLASIVLVLLPAVGRCGVSLAAAKSRRPSPISIVVITAAATVVYALLAGYRVGNGWARSALNAFRQFTGGTYEQSIDGSIGILAESTALVATLIVVMSFVVVARIVFRDAWDYTVARLRPYDLIVVGLGTSTVRLMEDIRSNSTLGDTVERIIIVERDRANPRIPRVRDLGAQVIIRELDENLLRQLATYPTMDGLRLRRKWKTEFILAFTSDEDFNLRVAEVVDSLRGSASKTAVARKKSMNVGHVVVSVRVDDLWTQERYWRNPITKTDTKTQIYVTNSLDTAAEDAFERAKELHVTQQGGDLSGPIVMVGYSLLGVAMLHKLRHEYLLHCGLDRMTDRYKSSASAAWKWESVHWIADAISLEASRDLLPRDTDWNPSEKDCATRLDVYHHETGEVDVVELVSRLKPSMLMVLGRDATTEWHRFAPCVDAHSNGLMIFVECDSAQRFEFDHGFGMSSQATLRGPLPIVTDGGLIRPGSRLHGHIGIVADAIHKYFTYKDFPTHEDGETHKNEEESERQQWKSEYLDPVHRESTFRLIDNALSHLDRDGRPEGYILQRVSRESERVSREKTERLTEEEVESAAISEYERYREERRKKKGRPMEEWRKADEKDRDWNRRAIRFLEEALFMIGFELVRRSEAGSCGSVAAGPLSSQENSQGA